MSAPEVLGSAVERLLAIKATPLFADVAPEDLAVIAEHAVRTSFAKGDALFSGDSEEGVAIHLVLEGSVVEHRGGRPFRTHGPQGVVGGIDALAVSTGDVFAVAEEDTQTLSLDRSSLSTILEDNFGILWVSLQGVAATTLRTRRRLPRAGFPERVDAEKPEPAVPGEFAARIGFLRRHTPLGRLSIRTLSQILLESEIVSPAGRHTLWSPGDSAEHALVVLGGSVAAVTSDGERFVAGPGTLLGWEEVLAMDQRWYGAKTRDAACLLSITRTALVDAIEDDANSAFEALAAMATIARDLRDLLARETERSD